VPEFIPVLLFFRRGVHHLIGLVKIGLRAMLVGSVWLICLPYFTVWVWRFYFWSGEYIAYRINGQYPPFRAENGINNSTREENPFSILYLKIAKGLLWYLPPEVENIIKEFGEFTSLDINSINLDDELKIKEAIGLSASRQWYLYDQIRDLVQNPNKRNNICPKPSWGYATLINMRVVPDDGTPNKLFHMIQVTLFGMLS
ncbi:17071_t:CDS:2, partial [Entrophospora sp. SA101]